MVNKIIKATPIEERKEFNFGGDRLVQKECLDEENKIYVYERYNPDGRLYGYEVVRGVRRKYLDEVVYSYPNSEQFGLYGYFISASHKEDIPYFYKKLLEKMKNKS